MLENPTLFANICLFLRLSVSPSTALTWHSVWRRLSAAPQRKHKKIGNSKNTAADDLEYCEQREFLLLEEGNPATLILYVANLLPEHNGSIGCGRIVQIINV